MKYNLFIFLLFSFYSFGQVPDFGNVSLIKDIPLTDIVQHLNNGNTEYQLTIENHLKANFDDSELNLYVQSIYRNREFDNSNSLITSSLNVSGDSNPTINTITNFNIFLGNYGDEYAVKCLGNYDNYIVTLSNFDLSAYNAAIAENAFVRVEIRGHVENEMQDISFHQIDLENTNDLLKLSWSPVVGADEYEVEYVFVEQGGSSSFNWNSKKQLKFVTNQNQYIIPLIYDAGELLVRVRAKNYKTISSQDLKYTSWLNASFTTTLFDNLTWNGQKQFAEEGKYKSSVTFFDTYNRPVQNVTNINDHNQVLRSEAFYDAEGRSAMNIVPVPDNNSLHYVSHFNRNLNEDPISLSDIESGLALSQKHGASKYYSSENETSGKLRDYIPKSNGYPYTLSKYSQDNLGKENKTTGLGETFKLDSDHTVETYFSKASVTEIQKFFGREIGDAKGYMKVVTKDPNGQLSASYYNRAGQVVATSMVGENPETVYPLLNKKDAVPLIKALDVGDENNGQVYSSNTFICTEVGEVVDFTHKFDLGRTVLNCDQDGFCYNCAYKVEFYLSDPCGASVELTNFSSSQGNVTEVDGKYTVEILPDFLENSLCSTSSGDGPSTNPSVNINFSSNIVEVGEYTLIKRIIAQEPSDEVLSPLAMCNIDVNEITAKYYNEINPEDCYYDYSDACKERILENNPGIDENSIEFENLLTDCLTNVVDLDNNDFVLTKEDYCNNTRSILLSSLNPSICEDFDIELVAPNFANVQFTITDYQGANYLWDGAKLIDIDDDLEGAFTDGQAITLSGLSGQNMSFNLSSTESLKELFSSPDYWQSQFADYLLEQGGHIQECKLLYCDSYYYLDRFREKLNNLSYKKIVEIYNLGLDINSKTVDNSLLTAVIADDPIELSIGCSKSAFTNYLNTEIENYSNYEIICAGQSCDFIGFVKALTSMLGQQANVSEFDIFKSLYNRYRNQFLTSCNDCAPEIPCGGYSSTVDEFVTNVDDVINSFLNIPNLESCDININNYIKSLVEVFHADKTITEQKELFEEYLNDENLRVHLEYVCTQLCNPYNTSVEYLIGDIFDVEPEIDNCFNSNDKIYKISAHTNQIQFGGYFSLDKLDGFLPPSCTSMNPPDEVIANLNVSVDIIDDLESDQDNSIFRFIVNPNDLELPIENLNSFLSRLHVSVYGVKNCNLSNKSLTELECNFSLNYHKKLIGEVVVPKGLDYSKLLVSFVKLKSEDAMTTNNETFVELSFTFNYRKQLMSSGHNRSKSNLYSLANLFLVLKNDYNLLNGSEGDDQKIEDFLKLVWNCNGTCAVGSSCFEEVFESADGMIESGGYVENIKSIECDENSIELTYINETIETNTYNRHTEVTYVDNEEFGYFKVENAPFCSPTDIIHVFSEEGFYYKRLIGEVIVIDVEPTIIPIHFFDHLAFPDVKFTGYTALLREKTANNVNDLSAPLFVDKYVRVYFLIESKNPETGSLITPCEVEIDKDLYQEDCLQDLIDLASYNIQQEIQILINNNLDKIKSKINCVSNLNESLTYSSVYHEYHHTLYYYDRAGNVIRTIAPKGVEPFGPEMFEDGLLVDSAPNAPPYDEKHFTNYKYNALNQLVESDSRDRGITNIEYDYYGRLRKTTTGSLTVFNKYDDLNRVIEYGVPSDAIVINDFSTPQLKDGVEVHYTEHDGGLLNQKNLRNKISYTKRVHDSDAGNIEEEEIYSYDNHGNVQSKVVNSFFIGSKRMDYDYDLISGNVKTFSYNSSEADGFYHKYTYDGDNRLKSAFTSFDGFFWDEDAKYKYYDHGPLARLEVGEEKVQGLDYRYTLQGWIKGVNFAGDEDLSNDGVNDGNNPYSNFASDNYSYNLYYYGGDYEAINASESAKTVSFYNSFYHHLLNDEGLYNGNITGTLIETDGTIYPRMYRYDQLHRLNLTFTYKENENGGFQVQDDYRVRYIIDPNGNMARLRRFRHDMIDNIRYNYHPDIPNRLRYTHDYIDNDDPNTFQGTESYSYNDRGNLIGILQKNVSIDWNYDDKVKSVSNDFGTTQFYYSPSGQRNVKVKSETELSWNGHYYVRDASDNVLAVYDFTKYKTGGSLSLTRKEAYLYGSSRLGAQRQEVLLEDPQETPLLLSRKRLLKFYEFSNHLGNVNAVIADGKKGYDDGSGIEYNTVVQSKTFYYPFGQTNDALSSNSSDYRYGFNGKEKDENNEFSDLTHYDYGFRIYNPSIARFLSVDPLMPDYPWYTPYQFAGNSPAMSIDIDGLEPLSSNFLLPGYVTSPKIAKFRLDFTLTVLDGILKVGEYINNNPNHAGYGYSPSMKAPDVSEFEKYSIKWNNVLDPYVQIENFAKGIVYPVVGVYDFGQGIYQGDGAKVAKSLPLVAMAVITVYSGSSFVNRFLSRSKATSPFLKNQEVGIWNNDEAARYLDYQGADAAYLIGEDGTGVLVLRKNATIQEVTEEIIHHNQLQIYGEEFMTKNRNFLEVEAQNELLNIGQKENWSVQQMDKIREAKKYWKQKLDNERQSNSSTSGNTSGG